MKTVKYLEICRFFKGKMYCKDNKFNVRERRHQIIKRGQIWQYCKEKDNGYIVLIV